MYLNGNYLVQFQTSLNGTILSCAQTMTKPLLTNGTRQFDQESKCAIWQHNKKAQ